MFNQTVYNLRKKLEAKRSAQYIIDVLEQREKNLGFRNFLIQHKSLLIEAKEQKKKPNEALTEMVDKYHQNLELLKQKDEKIAKINGEIALALEKQSEEREEISKERKKKKKRRRKKKKKTIQKYNEEINKNIYEIDWAEAAMLEEEI